MIVAFWNVNMGIYSWRGRRETFINWVKEIKPDMLLLEEVGDTISMDTMNSLTNMKTINFVNTLNRNFEPTSKRLFALQRINLGFDCRALRFDGLEQRRLLLKITHEQLGNFELWVIHANASQIGGRNAVDAVNSYLTNNPGAIVGGDFNCPIALAGENAVHPLSWNGSRMNFTQWNKTCGTTQGPDANLHIERTLCINYYNKIEPHNVIDYVIKGENRYVRPINNCVSEDTWINILNNFDHCPVIYEIT